LKKVNFLLPGGGTLRRNPKASGGYKVVYEYANMLVGDGYSVNIILPASLLWKETKLIKKIRSVVLYILGKIDDKFYNPNSWFFLDTRVKVIWVPSLIEKYIPIADYTFATGAETSEYLNKYSNNQGEKLYLIQGYENWNFNEKRLKETYKFNLKKIVISNWLKTIVDKYSSEESIVIENGLNFQEFTMDILPENKNKFSISMLYSDLCVKGSKYGLEGIRLLKKKYPKIVLNLFGLCKKPKNLEKWINYYYCPSRKELNNIYNSSALYLGTSLGEGWGLTLCEAMITGAAVVATNVNGYDEFCYNMDTALLVQSKNPQEMANKLENLILNDKLRYRIAYSGNRNIKKYTWERAYKILKENLK